jgi:Regulator of chromosome condensation (RCC1) repeat
VVDVACGSRFTLLLTASERVYACGLHNAGQCGLGPPEAVSVSSSLLDDVSVRALRLRHDCVYVPAAIPELEGQGVFAIAAGERHAAAVAGGGDLVFAWGDAADGRLGLGWGVMRAELREAWPAEREALGSEAPVFRPMRMRGAVDEGLTDREAAEERAMRSGGSERGGGGKGGDGRGKEKSSNSADPLLRQKLFFTRRVRTLACGGAHTALVTDDGAVYMCGLGSSGQLMQCMAPSDARARALGSWVQPRPQQTRNCTVPTLVRALFPAAKIVRAALGRQHSVLITENGVCFTAGLKELGACGVRSPVPYAALVPSATAAAGRRRRTRNKNLKDGEKDKERGGGGGTGTAAAAAAAAAGARPASARPAGGRTVVGTQQARPTPARPTSALLPRAPAAVAASGATGTGSASASSAPTGAGANPKRKKKRGGRKKKRRQAVARTPEEAYRTLYEVVRRLGPDSAALHPAIPLPVTRMLGRAVIDVAAGEMGTLWVVSAESEAMSHGGGAGAASAPPPSKLLNPGAAGADGNPGNALADHTNDQRLFHDAGMTDGPLLRAQARSCGLVAASVEAAIENAFRQEQVARETREHTPLE